MPTEADLGDVTRADAAVVHHQAVVVVLRNPKLDQFGCSLTSFNETARPKQKAAEKKRMFQPPSEQPTARDDDEVGNPPGKKMKKIFSVLKDVQGWYKKGICWRHGAKESVAHNLCVASKDVLMDLSEEVFAGAMGQIMTR